MEAKTAAAIKGYLEAFIDQIVNEYRKKKLPLLDTPERYLQNRSSSGALKPFHAAIIPEQLMRINAFERGFSTKLGTTFEEVARLVALEHHEEAVRSYDLVGEISLDAIAEIEHQISVFERAADDRLIKPSLTEMIDAVFEHNIAETREIRNARADLYILAEDGTEYYFEMKSPKPNKGQCLEVIQRILRFHLLRGMKRPKVQAYFSMAYNPYGPDKSNYKWSFAKMYTPFEQAVIIGQEFWSIVGTENTFTEVLEIYQEVGRTKSKYMIDALSFGF